MKQLLAQAVLIAMIVLLAGASRPRSTTMEQKLYLQRCTGSWWLSEQGMEDDSDYVVVTCEDHSDGAN